MEVKNELKEGFTIPPGSNGIATLVANNKDGLLFIQKQGGQIDHIFLTGEQLNFLKQKIN